MPSPSEIGRNAVEGESAVAGDIGEKAAAEDEQLASCSCDSNFSENSSASSGLAWDVGFFPRRGGSRLIVILAGSGDSDLSSFAL